MTMSNNNLIKDLLIHVRNADTSSYTEGFKERNRLREVEFEKNWKLQQPNQEYLI
jgi:hypothetical protein